MKTYLLAMLIPFVTTLAFTTSASAQAPPTPVTATRTSIPGHPLQVIFGAQPGSSLSFAGPDTTGLPHLDGVSAVNRALGNTVPTAIPGYAVTYAGADAGEGRFHAQVWFAADDGIRGLRLRAWTKTGEFVTSANANSPVTEVTQTTIGGLSALIFLPTAAVSGGNGPRTVYLTDGRTIWLLEIDGFTDNAAAMQLVETVADIVTTPGPPSTGSSLTTDVSDSSIGTFYILLGATLVIVSGATLLRIRQR